MIRVANIIEEGKLGGPQVRIAAVACALQERVETVVVLPEENSERFRDRLDACGTAYRAFRLSRITKEWRVALRFALFSWLEILRLARYFRAGDFDLVHVSGGSWQYKGVFAAKLAGCRVVWHLNDTSMPGLLRRLFGLLSSLPDAYVFASVRSQRYYGDLVDSGIHDFVVPAPVDTRHFTVSSPAGDEGELLANLVGKRVIGTVANVNRIKGIEVFIRTAARLNKRFDDLEFLVVGQIFPNQQKYYRDMLALSKQLGVRNLRFLDGRSDVRPLLGRMDIYLCSSHAESSPISVWEAMAMGKAIVSTDVGDVARYVEDGESGFIVDAGDDQAMAEQAAVLLDDSDLRARYGNRARQVAVDELDLSACADRHLEVYRYLLSLDNVPMSGAR